ncbi:tRNA-dihydrouridine(16/17) synthase [NAD(P)(+)]-like isoform X4 [Zalophus californianus]|nr:tRNA-dihydrouridine(16/17) synthase [NAD(P)(+)]-like isoform X4 [Zalophus californianus]
MIAKRGHYGAFLQEEWDLLQRMILLAHEKLSVPVTCKIRVFPEIDKTVKYAQMLEKAGCQLLTVHGRTKEQKGPLSGTASWEHIKAVRKAVAIPVFANGNIQSLRDVERCIQDTGVQGVMSAEGNLHNPALFEGRSPAVWELAEEYLDIVRQYPCPLSYVRAHLFKLWHHTLQVHQQLREELAKVKTLEGVAAVNQELKLRCQEDISRQKEGEKPSGGLPFFHWICQPYLRPGPREGSEENGAARSKRALEEEEGGTDVLSKNKQKKQLRNPHKTFDPSLKPKYAKCDQCGNPKVMDCFLEPNWRNLWPGRGPSPGCRSLSQQDLESQEAFLRLWAVPWPEGPLEPHTLPHQAPGLLLRPQRVPLKEMPLLRESPATQHRRMSWSSPRPYAGSPEMLHQGAGSQAGPAPPLATCVFKSEQ